MTIVLVRGVARLGVARNRWMLHFIIGRSVANIVVWFQRLVLISIADAQKLANGIHPQKNIE